MAPNLGLNSAKVVSRSMALWHQTPALITKLENFFIASIASKALAIRTQVTYNGGMDTQEVS